MGRQVVAITVNGERHEVEVPARRLLADVLRDELALTGTKRGCETGVCGACTVQVDGRIVKSCLMLAVQINGRSITTIEGMANGDELHPLQKNFMQCGGLQCGYCTPGQICSTVGMLQEAADGWASKETADLTAPTALTDAEIRERMSGNICRCSAYPQILAAIRDLAGEAA